MIIELEVISQYPILENNNSIAGRVPMRVFQNKLFVTESMQIEEHINTKGVKMNKFTTCKYDGEYYKLNKPYKELRDNYFKPIVIKGLSK